MFLDRLNEITKPVIHTKEIDLGLGDGLETFHFRELTFQERQDIFGARANPDGTGLELRGEGRYLGAEVIAATLCDENGKNIVRAAQVCKWRSDVVDKLSSAAMEAITPQKKAEDGEGNESAASS